MVGRDNPGDDRSNGGPGGVLSGVDLKDRVILALLAVIFGGSGAFGYLQTNDPRPDPYTGTMARNDQNEMRKWVQQELDRMTLRLDVVDRRLELIYEMRQDVAVMREKIERVERRLNGKPQG